MGAVGSQQLLGGHVSEASHFFMDRIQQVLKDAFDFRLGDFVFVRSIDRSGAKFTNPVIKAARRHEESGEARVKVKPR